MTSTRSNLLEGGDDLVGAEVLVVVVVDGVRADVSVSASCVHVAMETQLQILGKGHGPRLEGQGRHRGHLQRDGHTPRGRRSERVGLLKFSTPFYYSYDSGWRSPENE